MIYSHEVEHMCVVKKGPNHGAAPIPEEGKWVKAKEVSDISGLTHGIGSEMKPEFLIKILSPVKYEWLFHIRMFMK